jgi:transcriptional regulator with XRE-family HTH domain
VRVVVKRYDAGVQQTEFATLVKEARRDRGLSLRELADVLAQTGVKIDSSGLNRIEQGSREPRLSEARALTNVLGLDRDAVLTASADAETLGNQAAAREHFLSARKSVADFVRYFDAVGNSVVSTSHPDPNPAAAELRRELTEYVAAQEPAHGVIESEAAYYESLLTLVVQNIVKAYRWDIDEDAVQA